jgi:hypothetical protein
MRPEENPSLQRQRTWGYHRGDLPVAGICPQPATNLRESIRFKFDTLDNLFLTEKDRVSLSVADVLMDLISAKMRFSSRPKAALKNLLCQLVHQICLFPARIVSFATGFVSVGFSSRLSTKPRSVLYLIPVVMNSCLN